MAASSAHQRVLIVEDQEGVRKLLMVVLSQFYCVQSANTAGAGLEIIIDQPIDLVIMDVGLPDYDGVELLRRVRASGRDVKVIMISGEGKLESAKQALMLGAIAFLLKPFNLAEILTIVAMGLEPKQLEPVSELR